MSNLKATLKAAKKLINQRLKEAPPNGLQSYFVLPHELWHKYPGSEFITPEEAQEIQKTEPSATYFWFPTKSDGNSKAWVTDKDGVTTRVL